ncbi:hybrid sensor histidine kinase/response regulator [Haloarcula sp. CBA1130]|uniref:hybrid sensor histidine kinase/response regulator n=1 Tax=unclassified Haloarcula TaxID=2624677 RepID=UPI00124510ED|nr:MULTISPECIES: hybrid sensor histidine kinase/response regulator [unclassified Haloarcula]KAA9397074.1 hybrid sensor histidine kinase/response regulator [Haloarcula sp. CBA1129]KAA9402887.1 hybrid sensor histidine kinase/response regulator [Haloarcula sp. CBA1130]
MTPARGTTYLVVGSEATDLAGDLSETLTTDGVTAEVAQDTSAIRDRLSDGDIRGIVIGDDGDLNGVAVLEELRAAGAVVPIVFTAVDPDPERVTEALRAGATDYVTTETPVSLLAAKLEAYATRWPTDWWVGARQWDEISSGVSHDAKNPLNVIMGRLELLDIGEPHEDALLRSVRRVETLLTDLSRIGSIACPVSETASLSLADVATEVWAAASYEDATVEVATDATIDAENDRLQVLLRELFDNAVTHSEGSVTVTIGDTDSGFYVADDGPGIPDADRDEVFKQGFGTTTEGEGYGLFLVDTAARAHGWTVSVGESESGGTRIDVTTA